MFHLPHHQVSNCVCLLAVLWRLCEGDLPNLVCKKHLPAAAWHRVSVLITKTEPTVNVPENQHWDGRSSNIVQNSLIILCGLSVQAATLFTYSRWTHWKGCYMVLPVKNKGHFSPQLVWLFRLHCNLLLILTQIFSVSYFKIPCV